MPIENDIQQMKNDFGEIIQENEFITTSFINDGLRRIIFIESTDSSDWKNLLEKYLRVMKSLICANPEPMMNIISSYDEEIWMERNNFS